MLPVHIDYARITRTRLCRQFANNSRTPLGQKKNKR
jgi:hypothetical protein